MRALALVCLVACGGARPARNASRFGADADAFYWSYFEHNPKDGVGLGHHRYDGRLPDVAPAALAEWDATLARADASALGLHAGGMSVAASAILFRTRAYAGDDEALQQAVRGTFDPMYLNYTLGKLVIEKLRADWMRKTGKGLKAFHDAFLGYACAPLPLIRREMMGEEGSLL